MPAGRKWVQLPFSSQMIDRSLAASPFEIKKAMHYFGNCSVNLLYNFRCLVTPVICHFAVSLQDLILQRKADIFSPFRK
jgi:hypothetical protein